MSTTVGGQVDLVLVEIEPDRLEVEYRTTARSWPLERSTDGTLAPACSQRLRTELPAALSRHAWQPRVPARCTLPAAGVSLRRWQIPPVPSLDELHRVVRLRIESELPVAPERLAWGWCALPGPSSPPTRSTAAPSEIVVAATKREPVEEMARLLAECGLQPTFTLAAWARLSVDRPDDGRRPVASSPSTTGPGSWLALGSAQSEWLVADEAGPVRLRILPWGEQALARDIMASTGLGPEVVASILDHGGIPSGTEPRPQLAPALEASADALLRTIPTGSIGPRLHLTGRLAAWPEFVAAIQRRLGPDVRCLSLDPAPAPALSATLRGLRRQIENRNPDLTLNLETTAAEPRGLLARSGLQRWTLATAALLLAMLALPYAEAFLLGPRLATQLAAVKSRQDRLELIDRESDFLRTLRQEQAPALETLYVVSRTAPPGARIDSFVLNRKGELSLRIALRQPPEVTDFRSKLADSGFFSSVVIEEQAPTPDRQKINVRISAQVKAPPARAGLKILVPDSPASNAPASTPGAGPQRSAPASAPTRSGAITSSPTPAEPIAVPVPPTTTRPR